MNKKINSKITEFIFGGKKFYKTTYLDDLKIHGNKEVPIFTSLDNIFSTNLEYYYIFFESKKQRDDFFNRRYNIYQIIDKNTIYDSEKKQELKKINIKIKEDKDLKKILKQQDKDLNIIYGIVFSDIKEI